MAPGLGESGEGGGESGFLWEVREPPEGAGGAERPPSEPVASHLSCPGDTLQVCLVLVAVA